MHKSEFHLDLPGSLQHSPRPLDGLSGKEWKGRGEGRERKGGRDALLSDFLAMAMSLKILYIQDRGHCLMVPVKAKLWFRSVPIKSKTYMINSGLSKEPTKIASVLQKKTTSFHLGIYKLLK